MNTLQKRKTLFLMGCIPTRLALTYLAYYLQTTKQFQLLRVFGIVAILIGISFIYLNVTNSRQTGPEVFGDKIWWNSLRPVHGILYLSFGLLALYQHPYAYLLLLIDTLFGLGSFLHHHRMY